MHARKRQAQDGRERVRSLKRNEKCESSVKLERKCWSSIAVVVCLGLHSFRYECYSKRVPRMNQISPILEIIRANGRLFP